MRGPVLDAFVFLHGKGLVHSRNKPSNILPTADLLKLSSDALFRIGESRKSSSRFDVYDAPETAASALTPAADVWSLGMTLVETLTQRVPALQPGSQADPFVPDTLPQPLLDIARHALRRDPRRRCTIPEITSRLNPVAVAAAAGQSISPLAVPLSTVTPVPASKVQIPAFEPAASTATPRPARRQAGEEPRQALVLPNYVVPVAAVLLILVAIFALPKILGHRADSSSSATTTTAATAAPPKPIKHPARRRAQPAPKPAPAPHPHSSLH